jgi:hypothetical protein
MSRYESGLGRADGGPVPDLRLEHADQRKREGKREGDAAHPRNNDPRNSIAYYSRDEIPDQGRE